VLGRSASQGRQLHRTHELLQAVAGARHDQGPIFRMSRSCARSERAAITWWTTRHGARRAGCALEPNDIVYVPLTRITPYVTRPILTTFARTSASRGPAVSAASPSASVCRRPGSCFFS